MRAGGEERGGEQGAVTGGTRGCGEEQEVGERRLNGWISLSITTKQLKH